MQLTPGTIGALVSAMRRKDSRATVFAISTDTPWTGPEQFEQDGRCLRIRDARCPLALREHLIEPRGNDDLVILTSLDARAFGRENLARVALRRIEPVQPWPIVRLLFGVQSVDARLVRHSWMAERLMQAPASERLVSGGTLDFETAWGIVLAGFGLRTVRPNEEEFLAALSKPSFGQKYSGMPREGRDELRRVIEESLDRLGTTLLAVVERGYGDQVVAAGLVAQCIFEDSGPAALSARGAFAERFGVRGIDGAVASRWGRASQAFLKALGADREAVRIRAQADGILRDGLGASELAVRSVDLPSGLSARIACFAAIVEESLRGPVGPELLARLDESVRSVAEHNLQSLHDEGQRTKMAARLVRWLAVRLPPPAGIEEALRRYVDSDCWADRARAALQGGDAQAEVRRAYQELLKRVVAEREALNSVVATAISRQVLPSGAIIGVEHVMDRIVVPMCREIPVALVIMDGMSQSVALDIAESMEAGGWHRQRPRSPEGLPLVASVVPTVTEYARASLLSGVLRQGGQDQESSGFAEFLRSRGLASSRGGSIFHKSSLDSGFPAVERALSSDDKVVACVVNAIDDQLDGSDQLQVRWGLRSIPVLERIVRICESSGRAIVLVSDHGHVVDGATEQLSVDASASGRVASRWRSTAGPVRAGEVRAEGARVMVPGGTCVIASDERVRYGSRHAGYHGGGTAQEVSCPLHVLVHSSSAVALEHWLPLDRVEPPWWPDGGSAAAAAAAVAPHVRIAPVGRRQAAADAAMASGLFATATPGAWIGALVASQIFRDQCARMGRVQLQDADVCAMLEVFVRQMVPGSDVAQLTEQALAARIERSLVDTRRRVTMLKNLLNVDGYEVLSSPDRDSLRLDVGLLKAQFEILGANR